MGAGHWSARSKYFDTSVIHVDQLLESFDDYQEMAGESFKHWLQETHPGKFPDVPGVAQGGELIAWAKANNLHSYLEEALDDEYQFWDDPEAYVQDASEMRLEELEASVCASIAKALPGAKVGRASLKGREFWGDKCATVLAQTRFAQVVLRHWEGMLFFAIAPKNEVENLGPFLTSENQSDICQFVGRCWAACDPQNKDFSRYIRSDRGAAPVDLRPTEVGLSHDGRITSRLLDAVVARAVERATVLEAEDSEVDCQDFTEDFGIEPCELTHVHLTGYLDFHLECIEELSATPVMVFQGYQQELYALESALLNAMACNDEEPYRPDGAWTSKKVDLSPYRHVLAIQLDAAQVERVERGGFQVSEFLSGPRMSLMPEAVFDRTVTGSIQKAFPKAVGPSDDVNQLYVSSGNSAQSMGGVLVWRGHLEWLGERVQDKSDAWLRQGGIAPLSELPLWMTLSTDPDEIRATLDQVEAPVTSPQDVTGVLAETRDGDFGSVFVTYASRPYDLGASYEAVLLNGTAQTPSKIQSELSHG